MQQLIGNCLNPRAGDNRNDELLLMQRTLQFFQHSMKTLRLHRENDHRTRVRRFRIDLQRGLAVLLKHLDAILHVHLFAPSLPRMTPHNLIRTNQLLSQESGNNRLRHHAAADKSQTTVAERIYVKCLSSHEMRIAHPSTVELLYRLMTIDEQLAYIGKGTTEIIRDPKLCA